MPPDDNMIWKRKEKVSCGIIQFVRQQDKNLNPHASPPDFFSEDPVIVSKVREGENVFAAEQNISSDYF